MKAFFRDVASLLILAAAPIVGMFTAFWIEKRRSKTSFRFSALVFSNTILLCAIAAFAFPFAYDILGLHEKDKVWFGKFLLLVSVASYCVHFVSKKIPAKGE
jgi:hypothetical protein